MSVEDAAAPACPPRIPCPAPRLRFARRRPFRTRPSAGARRSNRANPADVAQARVAGGVAN